MNRQIGATLIVAGTTIGAGMLAMPLAAAPLGFLGSAVTLLVMWGLMYASAIIMVKCSLKTSPGHSIAWIAGDVFGKPYRHLLTGAIVLFSNAFLTAYMEGGASLLAIQFQSIDPTYLRLGFLSVLAAPLIIGVRWLDHKNRILFGLMIVIFVVIVALLIPHIRLENLSVQSPQSFIVLGSVIPIFFGAFGFHASIPSLIQYCGKDESQLKSIMFWGSLIPGGVYFLWLMVTEGVLPATGPHSFSSLPSPDVGMFMGVLGQVTGNSTIGIFSSLFAFLAIATSFLGVGYSLFHLIEERLNVPRFIVGILTFSPAYLVGILFPQGFITMLEYAAVFLSILAVISPTLVLMKLKEGSPWVHYGMLLFGVVIIILGV